MAMKVIFTVLLGLAVSLSLVAMNPKWRLTMKQAVLGETRTILAKVESPLQPGGPSLKVFKIKTGEDLSLEIYKSIDGGQEFALIQRISLPEHMDGFFTFQGNATNLALADIDRDGFVEILAPTFDDQGVARLSAFKYDPSAQGFQKMTASNLEP